MAINKKAIKGTGAIKLRDSLSSNDGTVINLVETWVGPYAELKTKQLSVILEVKATSLVATEAGEGELKITKEEELTSELNKRPPSVETTEVLWQELRQPVETAPFFKDLTAAQIHAIRDAAEGPIGEASLPEDAGEVGGKLYDLLRKGTTEWVTYVPVVRRTTTNVRGNVGSGEAGMRDDPPVSVSGTWEWLKTADERRKEGRRFDRVEEWTGGKNLSTDLYPGGGE